MSFWAPDRPVGHLVIVVLIFQFVFSILFTTLSESQVAVSFDYKINLYSHSEIFKHFEASLLAVGSPSPGVTTYVIAGISEPFDHPPCFELQGKFSARKVITIHLPQNKNVSAVLDAIAERNI